MFFGAILLKPLLVGGGGKADQKSFKYLYLFEKQSLFSAPVNRQNKQKTVHKFKSDQFFYTKKSLFKPSNLTSGREKKKKKK